MRGIRGARECQPVSQYPALAVLESLGTIRRYRRCDEIYSQNDPVSCYYHLVSGAARRFSTQPDGRRQIVDFLLPSDYFGFSSRSEHSFSVEAIVDDTLIARYPRAHIDALIDSDPRIARLLPALTAQEIWRLQQRILVLGRITAQEKIKAFLLEMAERLSDGRDRIVLPMSRYDVADYLAISVETVSRALTLLKQRGTIKLAGTRRVQLVDHDAFAEAGDDHRRWSA